MLLLPLSALLGASESVSWHDSLASAENDAVLSDRTMLVVFR